MISTYSILKKKSYLICKWEVEILWNTHGLRSICSDFNVFTLDMCVEMKKIEKGKRWLNYTFFYIKTKSNVILPKKEHSIDIILHENKKHNYVAWEPIMQRNQIVVIPYIVIMQRNEIVVIPYIVIMQRNEIVAIPYIVIAEPWIKWDILKLKYSLLENFNSRKRCT